MNSDNGYVFFIIAMAAILMSSNRVRYGLVALLVVVALVLGDILTIGQALAGFGSTVVILVACLLVIADRTHQCCVLDRRSHFETWK